jgi:hypothetical protein
MGNVHFWTSSGSCPLCLTPPCFDFMSRRPPAALFCYWSLSRNGGTRLVFAGRAANCRVKVILRFINRTLDIAVPGGDPFPQHKA